jgi:hypothetical protein
MAPKIPCQVLPDRCPFVSRVSHYIFRYELDIYIPRQWVLGTRVGVEMAEYPVGSQGLISSRDAKLVTGLRW